jgi:hypothetical protein
VLPVHGPALGFRAQASDLVVGGAFPFRGAALVGPGRTLAGRLLLQSAQVLGLTVAQPGAVLAHGPIGQGQRDRDAPVDPHRLAPVRGSGFDQGFGAEHDAPPECVLDQTRPAHLARGRVSPHAGQVFGPPEPDPAHHWDGDLSPPSR